MRIGLVINTAAGDTPAEHELARRIERHGHEVWSIHWIEDGPAALDAHRVDAVAVAGGDGSIRAVATYLSAHDVPVAVLPTGTANNVARSLGIPTDLDAAIASWGTAHPRALDLGIATGAWGERWFLESLGGGLVTHGIVVMDRAPAVALEPQAQVRRAVAAFADTLDHMAPRPWQLTVDGDAIAGEFLLVEALNMSAVGPRLTLSADASPWDGQLTVVAAGVEHRDGLSAYLRGRTDTPPLLPTWHGADVSIARGDRLHVDDEVQDAPDGTAVRAQIQPAAVLVLVGQGVPHVRDRPHRLAVNGARLR